MSKAGRIVGIAAVILAAVLWGAAGTAQALLPDGKQPLIVAAVRLAFGAGVLIYLAMLYPHSRQAFKTLPFRGVVFAGLAIGLYNVLFFLAVLETGVGVGTAIAIGSAPIWVTAYEIIVKRQFPDKLRIIGQTVSIVGACLLVIADRGGDTGSALGVILALFGGAAYATYSLATSQLSDRVPSSTLAAGTFSVAAIAVMPVFLFVPSAWLIGPDIWPALIFLGVFSTGAAYAFYTWGLTRIAASTAVTLSLVEPLTAWGLATFVVGEPLSTTKVVGALLLVVGLAIVTAFPKKTQPQPPEPR